MKVPDNILPLSLLAAILGVILIILTSTALSGLNIRTIALIFGFILSLLGVTGVLHHFYYKRK